MAKPVHPVRGSKGYSPRKRAKRIFDSFSTKTESDRVINEFAGYKVGMAHVVVKENRKGSVNYGKEVVKAVTIVEVPELVVVGVKAYKEDVYGKKAVIQVWSDLKNIPKEIGRRIPMPKKTSHKFNDLEKVKDEVDFLRLVVATQPYKTTIGKKKPEILELNMNGDIDAQINKAKDVLGKEIKINEIFNNGDFVDVLSVTKGKGFQGAVKRWGIKLLAKKSEKVKRKAGNLGPWHPHKVLWTVPQAGQMGFFRRTELNKEILGIYDDVDENLNKSGWKGYGVIRNNYILIKGSLGGPSKRLVVFREALRKPKGVYDEPAVEEIVV